MAATDGLQLVALHERQGLLVIAGEKDGDCVFRWSVDGGANAQTIPGTASTEVVVTEMDEEQPAIPDTDASGTDSTHQRRRPGAVGFAARRVRGMDADT